MAADGLPRVDSVALDITATLFACVVAAAATVAVGLLPALYQSDTTVGIDFASSRNGQLGSARLALRAAAVAQLALSVVLLTGATLLGRSLVMLMSTDLGVTPDQVATASLNLAMDRTLTDQQQIDLVNRVVDRISALPDVRAAGVGAARPPNASRVRVTLRRTDDPNERASYQAAGVPATPGYFAALGIRPERGRFFTEADHRGAPPVVIMSADTARRLFPEQDPLGGRIRLPVLRDGRSASEEMTVVGITANVKYGGIDQTAEDVIYIPFAQHQRSAEADAEERVAVAAAFGLGADGAGQLELGLDRPRLREREARDGAAAGCRPVKVVFGLLDVEPPLMATYPRGSTGL